MPHSILILTNRIPYPLHDGGALAMDAMIRGYQKAGWRVHLLAMNTSRHFVSQEVLKGLYGDLAGFTVIQVDNTLSIGRILKNLFFSRQPEHVDRFRSKGFTEMLARILESVRPDLVQLESPFLSSYIPTIRRHSRAKIVYRAHNVEGQIWSRLAAASSGLKRIYLKILSRRIAHCEEALWKMADVILPITEADASFIRKSGTKAAVVNAPFAVRTNVEEIAFPPGPLKVYHIGAMDWLPNQEAIWWFLKEVWPLLHHQAPQVEFHFAGRAMPESLKQDLPVGVFCHGEVPDAKEFSADKHILVVPLRSGSGIRVKTLEAMAAGKLVVSTDIGIQGIDARPDLHYLRANTAREFSGLIAWASTHPAKAESIARSGQQLIRTHYDEEAIMQNIVNAIG